MGGEMSCGTRTGRFVLRYLRRLHGLTELIIAASMAVALAGCGVIRGAPEPITDASQVRTDLSNYLTGDVLRKYYVASDSERNDMSQTAWRDAVIAARIELVDQNYQAFKNQLYGTTAGLNLVTDLAALGLSGAAAVSGAGAAQSLAAASAGVIGAGIAFNKDAFYQKTLPAIFAQMEADRLAVLVRIRTAQATDPGGRYSLATALSDIAAYERAGTLETAIQALTTSATNQANASKAQLDRIFSYGSRDAAAKTLEDLLTGADGKPDQTKRQAMRACFPAAGVPLGTETGDLLLGPEFAEARTRVVACMQAPRPAAAPAPAPRAAAPAAPPPVVLALDASAADIRALIVDQRGRITPAGGDRVVACYPAAQVPPGTSLITVLGDQAFAEARKKILACMQQPQAGH
jgi:hypothetical protein